MAKKQKQIEIVSNETVVANAVSENTATQELEINLVNSDNTGTSESKVPGRPVNPNSARQRKLADMEKRKSENGGFTPLGRPVNPNSSRQQKLAEIEARKASGEVIHRGRPKMTEEEKQQKRAEYQEKLAAHQAMMAAKGPHAEPQN